MSGKLLYPGSLLWVLLKGIFSMNTGWYATLGCVKWHVYVICGDGKNFCLHFQVFTIRLIMSSFTSSPLFHGNTSFKWGLVCCYMYLRYNRVRKVVILWSIRGVRSKEELLGSHQSVPWLRSSSDSWSDDWSRRPTASSDNSSYAPCKIWNLEKYICMTQKLDKPWVCCFQKFGLFYLCQWFCWHSVLQYAAFQQHQ